MAERWNGKLGLPTIWTYVIVALLVCQRCYTFEERPIPLVLPLDSRSQLAVQREGLALLSSIPGPVSPVVVIGPYRSGKSFTLNQLLGVPCDKGFGVGHTRETETKGMWVWGAPLVRNTTTTTTTSGGRMDESKKGEEDVLLFIDTEGFESTGKSNSYDDRIFALSALLSSLLIYNLPETIRESDVAKLSFAVELARGFYDKEPQQQQQQQQEAHSFQTDSSSSNPSSTSLDPGAMLWLIQRDFLRGTSAADLVAKVLAPVDNPKGDPGLEALNQVRASLSSLAPRSTGFSLAQPHLDRTRLCELQDSQLEPTYVTQREQLKGLVQSLARPKALRGRPLTGPDLARLLDRMVAALNEQEIPTATSLLAVFNRDVLARCVANYTGVLAGAELPLAEEELEGLDAGARAGTLEMLSSLQIGRKGAVDMRTDLIRELERAYQVRRTENLAASNTLCSDLENKCEAQLDALQGMRLPSLRKFESSHRQCAAAFQRRCLGPAKAANAERLDKAWARARKAFARDYNDRLFTGLLVASLVAAVVFRFLLRVQLLEGAAWAAFLFLELYPKLHPTGSLYDTQGWAVTVRLWEVAMMVLFGFSGSGLVWVGLLAAVGAVRMCCYRGRRQQQHSGGSGGGGGGLRTGGGGGGERGKGGLLGMGGFFGALGGGGRGRRKHTPVRDLDV